MFCYLCPYCLKEEDDDLPITPFNIFVILQSAHLSRSETGSRRDSRGTVQERQWMYVTILMAA